MHGKEGLHQNMKNKGKVVNINFGVKPSLKEIITPVFGVEITEEVI